MLDISIIIVSYNTQDLLRTCLNSISKTIKSLKYELIIVDNHSVDKSVEMIVNEFPWVKLIANEENKGFASANNQAIKIARGKYIVLLNPDTIVLPNSFIIAFNFLNKNNDVGALGCQLLNPDRSLQISCASNFPSIPVVLGRIFVRATGVSYIFDRFFPNLSYPFKFWLTPKEHQYTREVAHLTGACLWIRKKVFYSVGLFDDQYFMYFEETELCYRIKKQGWRIYYLPEAHIIHVQHASARKSKSFFIGEQEYLFYKNRLIFFKKHRSSWELFFYRILTVLSIFVKSIHSDLRFILRSRPDEMQIYIHTYLRILKLCFTFK